MKGALTELEKDFKEMLECIDFKKYDPYSKLYMRALFIGQMYMCVKALGEDDVEEELDGASKYMYSYLKTNEESYKEMAKDELKHAGMLIKLHYAAATDSDEKEHLEEQENKRQEMLSRLSKWSEA